MRTLNETDISTEKAGREIEAIGIGASAFIVDGDVHLSYNFVVHKIDRFLLPFVILGDSGECKHTATSQSM